jgi:hypothetical protein
MGPTCERRCDRLQQERGKIYSHRRECEYYIGEGACIRCARSRKYRRSAEKYRTITAISLLLISSLSGCGIFHGADGSTAVIIFPVTDTEAREAPSYTKAGASQAQCQYKGTLPVPRKNRVFARSGPTVRNLYFGVKNIHVGACLYQLPPFASDLHAGGNINVISCHKPELYGYVAKVLHESQKAPHQTGETTKEQTLRRYYTMSRWRQILLARKK